MHDWATRIGVDFHPEFQQIALVDTDTGELEERRLHHPDEAEAFYRALKKRDGRDERPSQPHGYVLSEIHPSLPNRLLHHLRTAGRP
jgi:hypothetical protein